MKIVPCHFCNGTGTTYNPKAHPCSVCKGVGSIVSYQECEMASATEEAIDQYVIKSLSTGQYVGVEGDPINNVWNWKRTLKEARLFDSMAEAASFCHEADVSNYRVVHVLDES